MAAFGPQEVLEGDNFSTVDSKFIFHDPFKVEMLETDIVELLVIHDQPLVYLTFDLAMNGIWPLLTCLVNLGEPKLKMSSLKLLTALMQRGCISKSPKLLLNFVSLIFTMVKNDISGEFRLVELSQHICLVLDAIYQASKNDPILERICDRETEALWSFISEFNIPLNGSSIDYAS